MTGPGKALTIKQAKASFKSRGQPSISEKELKQLRRARELEQRAWRAKEQERRRLETSKKRAEKEKQDKLDRQKAQLGSQRRCDRFGYQSSQFHLGKFFGVGRAAPDAVREEPADEPEPEQQQQLSPAEQEDFFEDEIDDLALLGALEVQPVDRIAAEGISEVDLTSGASSFPPTLSSVHSLVLTPQDNDNIAPTKSETTAVIYEEDLSGFWDDLESSTQIARDLNTPQLSDARNPGSKSSSFSFEDLDLTTEDLDRLDPPKPMKKTVDDRILMPPPAFPPQRDFDGPAYVTPTTPAHKSASGYPAKHPSATHDIWRSCSVDLGLTSSQLESLVDEEIVLTQLCSG